AGADRVLTMDLHAPQIQGFFSKPVDNLIGANVLCSAIKDLDFAKSDDLVVVSPDVGSVSRARTIATKLDCPLAIVDKRRPKANVMEVMNIVGDVKGKTCLLVDDMIDTAGTITQGAKALVEVGGAKEVYVCCTHAVMSGPAIERMKNSVIKKVYMLNTIELTEEKQLPMFEEISVAPIFATAIKNIFEELPLSNIYDNL
ncbi:MAG: ribose-phosphate diphosphokinase, partial [Clostridia bacterium]|nr:ribose-phosphate diphosphokinase [Clostridia bacterium]